MPYVNNFKHAALNALRNVAFQVAQVYVSAHNGDPSTTGANEISGGSPAYARKALNFSAASSGSMASSNSPVLDIPSGETVAWLGLWDASSGGNFLGSIDVTNETYGAQGTYTVTSVTLDLNA